jgi:ribonuclease HI
VTIKVIVEEQTAELKLDPKILTQDLVHKVAQTLSRNVPGWWHACVIDGMGDNQTYQEGDTVKMYAASNESIEMVNAPRTPKGSEALIPKTIGGPLPKKRAPKVTRDWIWELCERGETPIHDAKQFADQIIVDKMVRTTTDGGADPNPGPAGWGVLVRQNGKFLCLWKHYPKSSNNAMEISAVMAGLNYLPSGMIIWLSTDSQYVQKGVTEWMPKWKRNGWRNSKKAGITNKSLWLGLEAAIARHRRIEFTWVKPHSGILHNEIADTLATRGVKGTTYCPINWFDQLPEDTETEDDLNIPPTEIITQTDEFGADEEHLPSFGTLAVVHGLNNEEAAEREEERDRSIRHFLYEQCGNSSTPVSEDEEFHEPNGTVLIQNGWTALGNGGPEQDQILDSDGNVQRGNSRWSMVEEEQMQNQESDFSLQIRRESESGPPDSVAPSPWSSSWAQARAEAQHRREFEERFSWMKEADTYMLSLGLEPYPWDKFAEEIEKTGEMEFQAIEQRANAQHLLQADCSPDATSVVGATLVVRSHTIVTALNIVSGKENASQATARMLFRMAEALPVGAQLDMIVSTEVVLLALGACADILSKGWDIDFYCQDPEWKNMMVTWKNKQLRAVCRKVDEERLDVGNSPFLMLAIEEVRQTVTDAVQGGGIGWEEELGPESSVQ